MYVTDVPVVDRLITADRIGQALEALKSALMAPHSVEASEDAWDACDALRVAVESLVGPLLPS